MNKSLCGHHLPRLSFEGELHLERQQTSTRSFGSHPTPADLARSLMFFVDVRFRRRFRSL